MTYLMYMMQASTPVNGTWNTPSTSRTLIINIRGSDEIRRPLGANFPSVDGLSSKSPRRATEPLGSGEPTDSGRPPSTRPKVTDNVDFVVVEVVLRDRRCLEASFALPGLPAAVYI